MGNRPWKGGALIRTPRLTVSFSSIAAVLIATLHVACCLSAWAGETPSAPPSLEVLRQLQIGLAAGEADPRNVCREVEELRFRADDPTLPIAAEIVEDLAEAAERIAHERQMVPFEWAEGVERLRQRARQLKAGITTVPIVWDPERLRKGWIVTAEARHDIDGDGVEDLFVGVREGGNHALCWTCHALVYKRRDGAWHLAWERAYQTYGYPSKGACSFGFRDFDGDGREEFTVTVNVECFGNGGGGGCWVEKVYGWDSHGQPPAALMLEFPRKSFGST